MFTSRRPEEPQTPSTPEPPAARRGETDPPRRSISRVSNETFDTQLDELDRLFADELVDGAPASNGPIVAGLRSKQDIVNAFRHLLAAERAETEAKAMLAPGGNPQAAEITVPKSVDLTTLRLKVELRTDAEGRTVLSITVE